MDRAQRATLCKKFAEEIEAILAEKEKIYGVREAFDDAGGIRVLHAFNEVRLKLREYLVKGDVRLLVKAAAWLYLTYEEDRTSGNAPRED